MGNAGTPQKVGISLTGGESPAIAWPLLAGIQTRIYWEKAKWSHTCAVSLNTLIGNCVLTYSKKIFGSKDRPIFIVVFIFKVPVSLQALFSWPESGGGGWEVCSRANSTGIFSRSRVSKSPSCCHVPPPPPPPPRPQLPRVFPF